MLTIEEVFDLSNEEKPNIDIIINPQSFNIDNIKTNSNLLKKIISTDKDYYNFINQRIQHRNYFDHYFHEDIYFMEESNDLKNNVIIAFQNNDFSILDDAYKNLGIPEVTNIIKTQNKEINLADKNIIIQRIKSVNQQLSRLELEIPCITKIQVSSLSNIIVELIQNLDYISIKENKDLFECSIELDVLRRFVISTQRSLFSIKHLNEDIEKIIFYLEEILIKRVEKMILEKENILTKNRTEFTSNFWTVFYMSERNSKLTENDNKIYFKDVLDEINIIDYLTFSIDSLNSFSESSIPSEKYSMNFDKIFKYIEYERVLVLVEKFSLGKKVTCFQKDIISIIKDYDYENDYKRLIK